MADHAADTLCSKLVWALLHTTTPIILKAHATQVVTFLSDTVCLSLVQYSAAQFLIEVPYMLFMATFYSLIVYSMIGEPPDAISWPPALCAVSLIKLPFL